MERVILLGANWCPVTRATRELFDELRKEKPDFDYEYIDINSEKGRQLVKKFSVTGVPKVIFQDKIIFHTLPPVERLFEVIKDKK